MSKGVHNLKNYQVYKQKFKISGLEKSLTINHSLLHYACMFVLKLTEIFYCYVIFHVCWVLSPKWIRSFLKAVSMAIFCTSQSFECMYVYIFLKKG